MAAISTINAYVDALSHVEITVNQPQELLLAFDLVRFAIILNETAKQAPLAVIECR